MTLENQLKRANIDFSWIHLGKGSPVSLPSLFLQTPHFPFLDPFPPPFPALMPQPSPTPSLTPQGRTPYRGRGWAPSMKKIKIIPSSTFCQKFKFYVLDRFSPFRLAAAMELVILYKALDQSSSSSLCIVKIVEKEDDFSYSNLSSTIFLFAVLCWLSLVANPLPTHQSSSSIIFLFYFLWDFCHFKYTMSFVCQLWTSFPAQKVDLGNKGGQFPRSRHLAQKAEKMDYGLDSSQQKLRMKINWFNYRSGWLFPRFGFDLSLEKLCVSASASETWLSTLEQNLRSSGNLSHQQLLRGVFQKTRCKFLMEFSIKGGEGYLVPLGFFQFSFCLKTI